MSITLFSEVEPLLAKTITRHETMPIPRVSPSETLFRARVEAGEDALREIWTGLDEVVIEKEVECPTVESSLDPLSFITLKDGVPRVKPSFLEALGFLKTANPETYKALAKELAILKSNLENPKIEDKCEGLKRLKLFVEYQVFKTGEHIRVYDEIKWAKDNTANFLGDAKNGNNPQLAKLVKKHGEKAVQTALEKELPKHFMCRCRYSKKSPTVMRHDLPAFALERMKREPIKKGWHRFDGKSKEESGTEVESSTTIAYARSLEPVKPQTFGLESLEGIDKIPFDDANYGLYMVQVPVMSEGLTVELLGEKVKLGDDPESIGIDMSEEFAGVFKRSLNSQRVIEIADLGPDGKPISFQMKGSGVPSYGFCAFEGSRTGAEVFDIETEKCCMDLDFFSTALGFPNVVPSMGSIGNVCSDPEKVYMDQSAGRQGGASSRFDIARGVRLSDLTGHPDEKKLAPDKDDSPEEATRKKKALKMLEESKAYIAKHYGFKDGDQWRKQVLEDTAMSQAVANLFGLVYNDTNVEKMGDVSVFGGLSDSGGLFSFKYDDVLKTQGAVVQQALTRGFERVLIPPEKSGDKQARVEVRDGFTTAYLKGIEAALLKLAATIKKKDSKTASYIEGFVEVAFEKEKKDDELKFKKPLNELVDFLERMYGIMMRMESEKKGKSVREAFSTGGMEEVGRYLAAAIKKSEIMGMLKDAGQIELVSGMWIPKYKTAKDIASVENVKTSELWKTNAKEIMEYAIDLENRTAAWMKSVKGRWDEWMKKHRLLVQYKDKLVPMYTDPTRASFLLGVAEKDWVNVGKLPNGDLLYDEFKTFAEGFTKQKWLTQFLFNKWQDTMLEKKLIKAKVKGRPEHTYTNIETVRKAFWRVFEQKAKPKKQEEDQQTEEKEEPLTDDELLWQVNKEQFLEWSEFLLT